jgi:hypothetical protein|tara:strand:+ start:6422 stop:7207 length:786 start_codon:yes stop_codon:yes gene_type:complete
MINWSEKFETKYSVIDITIKENWDLVKEYVKRVESSLKLKYQEKGLGFKFTELDAEYAALYCIIDLTKALGKFIRKEDELVESTMLVKKGLIEGQITIKRNGEEHYINTRSIYASGDIQRLHIRYLVDSSLPRITGKTPAQITLEAEKRKMSKLEKIQEDIRLIEKSTERYKVELKRLKKLNLKSIISDNKEKYPFTPENYESDDQPGSVHKNEETHHNFISEMSKKRLKIEKDRIVYHETLIKDNIKRIEKLKKKLSESK